MSVYFILCLESTFVMPMLIQWDSRSLLSIFSFLFIVVDFLTNAIQIPWCLQTATATVINVSGTAVSWYSSSFIMGAAGTECFIVGPVRVLGATPRSWCCSGMCIWWHVASLFNHNIWLQSLGRVRIKNVIPLGMLSYSGQLLGICWHFHKN